MRVPEILSGGNHAQIAAWRREQAIARTRERRPDLWERFERREKERGRGEPEKADNEKGKGRSGA
jgi:tRNA (guanine37-N1)-methyltransferase